MLGNVFVSITWCSFNAHQSRRVGWSAEPVMWGQIAWRTRRPPSTPGWNICLNPLLLYISAISCAASHSWHPGGYIVPPSAFRSYTIVWALSKALAGSRATCLPGQKQCRSGLLGGIPSTTPAVRHGPTSSRRTWSPCDPISEKK